MLKIKKTSWLSEKHSYGVSLALVGLPIVWVIRDLVSSSNAQEYSFIFMAMSIALLIYLPNITNIISALFLLPFSIIDGFVAGLPFAFLIPALFASISTNIDGDLGAIYLGFVIVFLLAINTVPYEQFKYLPEAFLVTTALGCLLIIYQIAFSSNELLGQRLTVGQTNSPGPISIIGATAIISGFSVLPQFKNKLLFRWLIYATIIIGSIVTILAVKRGTIIGITLCIIILLSVTFLKSYLSLSLRQKEKAKKKSVIKIALEIALVITIIILLVNIFPDYFAPIIKIINLYISRIITYFQLGSESFFYNSGVEQSAAYRRKAVEYAFANMNEIGHGYKSLWIDVPVLQAFYDGGILGGSVYLIVAFLVPTVYALRILFRYKETDRVKMFCSYIYFLSLPSLFSSGQPYDFFMWLRIILLYSVLDKPRLNHNNRRLKI
jgi:hypothetical protein